MSLHQAFVAEARIFPHLRCGLNFCMVFMIPFLLYKETFQKVLFFFAGRLPLVIFSTFVAVLLKQLHFYGLD